MFADTHPDANSEPQDIEDLVRMGEGQGPCPYYMARHMAAGADIVFMPYNYLVGHRTRTGLKTINWKGAVLIFDEAHNLQACAHSLECCAGSHHHFARLEAVLLIDR